jgi:hypothetical protein
MLERVERALKTQVGQRVVGGAARCAQTWGADVIVIEDGISTVVCAYWSLNYEFAIAPWHASAKENESVNRNGRAMGTSKAARARGMS